MFQSIKYLDYTYDNKTNLYHYQYEITDSNFVSTAAVARAKVAALAVAALVAAGALFTAALSAAVIKEYENRKYDHKEIVSNLFLLNMFLLKDNWWYKDLNQILKYQHKYIIKENFPETNFNEKYYDDLVKYTKKMMVIS